MKAAAPLKRPAHKVAKNVNMYDPQTVRVVADWTVGVHVEVMNNPGQVFDSGLFFRHRS
jgi:hypothetical protein